MSAPTRGTISTLTALSLLELLSLAVLLTNLATVHADGVTSVMGPVHGAAYLSVAVIALLTRGLRTRTRVLVALPVIGGICALTLVPKEARRLGSETASTEEPAA
ncbi:hypothetical protein SAXI111661_15445 [Saccharomonospora xinjiangensis]|uniref:hypothetical protein n=1 Tax=Saccharomonospora xinjiangensis TaxID=75294 RepID=UPI00106F9E6B|nr:hypothetical protein [Saccharomonospora xinjiangensis]QBQ61289.1 hypothetical protein EYD13_14705 [Saccharomonospora xinjiangensis]